MTWLLPCLGLAALLAACQQLEPATVADDDTGTQAKAPLMSCTGLGRLDSLDSTYLPSPYDSIKVEGDSLKSWFRYGGGCRDHSFIPLCADFDTTREPTRVTWWVRHIGSHDPCLALIYGNESYEIASIKAKAGPDAQYRVRYLEDIDTTPGIVIHGPEDSIPRISREGADSLARTSDPFTIDSSRVMGDSLFVWVGFGGGCRKHIFTPYASDYILKSWPPQVDFWIHHDADGDFCRAYIHERLAFDIRMLKGRIDADLIFRVHPLPLPNP